MPKHTRAERAAQVVRVRNDRGSVEKPTRREPPPRIPQRKPDRPV